MVEAVWLIPALPLAGFLILAIAGRRLGNPRAGWLATAMMVGSFGATLVVLAGLLGYEGEARSVTQTLFTWVPSGALQVEAGFLVDPLSVTMAMFVTGVGALIHLYSIGYMHSDPNYTKFFVYLNLFAFSMLMLVLSSSFLGTFLGWEGVGACSYFLISFWFEKPTAATAGKKAFVVNRVGDFGFMVAMFLIFASLGSLQYVTVAAGAETLSTVTATAIALLLFVGAAGKSAQLPLYVWLPDAMEGPTPVSALIHAATMVTAGVFLMVRINPILALAPDASMIIAVVGALTALFAATIACAQNDIKKVLAYSTISQLGYMFLAVGSGAYAAAIFHMVTHAFFKALMFLGAGSVIHGLHEEQDMTRMGGLRKWMPVTSGTFLVGWLAIAGVPPFSGFWSKDDILANAFELSPLLWGIGLLTALLTAYYMSRQVFLVFFGGERWRSEPARTSKSKATKTKVAAGHHGGRVPHESPWAMTFPLAFLAVLATLGGLLNLPFPGWTVLEHWLEPVFGENLRHLALSSSTKLGLIAAAVAAALAGIGVAWATFGLRGGRVQGLTPPVLARGWYVDDLYRNLVERPGRALSNFSATVVDQKLIDGVVNGLAASVRAGGERLRVVQSGYVRNYALAIAGGTVGVLVFVLVRSGV